jgi:hypothetical protein
MNLLTFNRKISPLTGTCIPGAIVLSEPTEALVAGDVVAEAIVVVFGAKVIVDVG